MKSRWVIAGAAALSLALLTLPSLRGRSGGETISSNASEAAPPKSASCDADGVAKLDFVLKNEHNEPVKLEAYKGKVVLLNFWATWCGPCKTEIPDFIEVYNKYKEKGFVVLGVSVDDSPEQLQAFMKEMHMNYPVLQMTEDFESAFGPFYGYPTSFFITRDGSICSKHLGPVSKDLAERQIEALL